MNNIFKNNSMNKGTIKTIGILLLLPLFVSACGGSGEDSADGSMTSDNEARVAILGAGATFPAPLITTMADEYRELTDRRVTVNYQSIGSGGGIRQFIEQTVMFGVSEAFLSDDVIADIESSTGGRAFNMPITLADVVPTYNLPALGEGVVFDGELLVDIFLGNVTMWNDPRIRELNADKEMPALPITVVHRSDGSGTTNIWTSYLSRVSEEWANQVGYATSVNWPAGIGGNGNEGVAGMVVNTPGSIGYNSLSYALLNDMSFGYVINASGNIIEPSFAATSEAANIDLPDDTRVLFTNTPAENGYPAAGFAWLLVYENLDRNNAINSRESAGELIEFLLWCMTDGQELSESLGYAKLPEAVVEKNFAMIGQLKWEGEMIGSEMLEKNGLN